MARGAGWDAQPAMGRELARTLRQILGDHGAIRESRSRFQAAPRARCQASRYRSLSGRKPVRVAAAKKLARRSPETSRQRSRRAIAAGGHLGPSGAGHITSAALRCAVIFLWQRFGEQLLASGDREPRLLHQIERRDAVQLKERAGVVRSHGPRRRSGVVIIPCAPANRDRKLTNPVC